MKIGDRVFITDRNHPWHAHAGSVIALDERYGLGWTGHRVKLDSNCGETYIKENQVRLERM